MNILFFMRSTVYVRNFESTLRLLAERGHRIHIVAHRHNLPESNELVARLCREYPQIRHTLSPAIPFNAWSYFGVEVRRGIDYLRYLEPEFADAPKLRARAETSAPEFVHAALRHRVAASAGGRRLLGGVLRLVDRAAPRHPAVDAFIRDESPDLVLVTPLVEPGSPQSQYLRSARALGIPTALCVYSWDNLTNKGLIHDPVDLVTVWNELMKQEAMSLHGVPEDRIVVTGAAPHDHWFAWRPREDREAFCTRVGLDSARPYLLYLCSSQFIAPDEVPFVRRWVTELRQASALLRDVGVLVRPHPQNTRSWQVADVSDLGHVTIWPRKGGNPVDADSRGAYYDSIYHSAAVVGVNTTAQIESAIVGRGVYTILTPEFRETQEGTLHFRHLTHAGGGLLHVAEDFTEHTAELEAAIRNPHSDAERCRRFVEAFIRPHGLHEAATPRLVAALERTVAQARRRRDAGAWWAPPVRLALARVVARLGQTEQARKAKTVHRKRQREQRKAALVARKVAGKARKLRADAERAARREQAEARQAAERRAAEALAARAYDYYVEVREKVRDDCAASLAVTAWSAGGAPRRGTAADRHQRLTEAERRMTRALEHLWDAAPDTIANLRQFCEPITGVSASDYQAPRSDLALRLRAEVRRLQHSAGTELFVSEPLTLGGFGFTAGGGRYNEDTVRYFNALVALQDGGVLAECRGATSRRVVWEVGGGWGGFAYQFKTVCPNVTYVITGLPELLLVSAVYLKTVLPDARCQFFDERQDLWQQWEHIDFLFVPESAVAMLRPPRLDVTLDITALPAMSADRVRCHVQHAFEFESRYFYSLLPGSSVADDVPSTWKAIEQRYWPHRVPSRLQPILNSDVHTGDAAHGDYAHLVGWRRIQV